MASETDLLNDALGQIGVSPITAIDDGSINANYCKRFYPALRDALTRSHHWNWALKRIELAQDAIAPLFGYAYSYTLPSDCLKVVEFNGANTDTTTLPLNIFFKIEGRNLLTNDGTVKIGYLSRVTDPNVWDGLFYQAMGTWLASKLASAITKDTSKSIDLLGEAQSLFAEATAVDGQEGTVSVIKSDALTWGR